MTDRVAGSVSLGGGEFLPGLHALRMIAAAWVVIFHISDRIIARGVSDDLALRFLDRSNLAVDLFFVMSGFIIARRYSEEVASGTGYRRFLLKRIARIYPMHFLMLVIVVVFLSLAAAAGKTLRSASDLVPPDEVLRHLFLVQAWGREGHSLNVPAWTVSVDWLLYLLFPLLVWPFRRGGPRLAIGALILLCALRLVWDRWLDLAPEARRDLFPVVTGFIGFGCGMALERLVRTAPPPWAAKLGWACGLLIPPVLLLAPDYWPGFLLLLPLMAAAAWHRLPGLPDRWAFWTGEVSYALYMVHGPVIFFIITGALERWPAAKQGPAAFALGAVAFLVSLFLAWRAHKRIEVPGRRWIMRRFGGRSLDKAARPA